MKISFINEWYHTCNAMGVFKQIIFVKQPQLKIIVSAGKYGRREL